MTPEPGSEARVTARQAVLWGLVFAAILALVALSFLYGKDIQPLLG